jgi:hypothetical protein
MSMSIKKRLALGAGALATVGAVGTLVAGVTFGLFTATTPTQSNTFTAGQVTLAQSAATSCTTANIQPGDSGTCAFTVTYNGSGQSAVSGGALLGVDVAVSSTATGSSVQAYAPGNTGSTPTAALGLYDSTANGLQITVTDSQTVPVTYMSGTTLNGATTTGVAPSANDLLVSKTAVVNGFATTFTINWSLPSTANNAYQAAGSKITLIVHAVQAANNGSTSACTAGLECDTTSPGAGAPAWS